MSGPAHAGMLRAGTRRRRIGAFGLRVVVLVAAVSLIAWQVDVAQVVRSLATLPATLVAAGFALGLLRVFLLSVRWRVLDDAGLAEREAALGRPVQRLGQWQYFRYRLANSTFNLFLPTAIGADVARAALVASEIAEDRARRVAVIVFDRLLGLVSIALLGLAAGLAAPDLAHAGAYLGAILALNVVLLGVLAVGGSRTARRGTRAIGRHLGSFGAGMSAAAESLGEAFATFRRHPGAVALALGLCGAIHLTSFVLVDVTARALRLDLAFSTLAVVTTISWVIVLLPVSIGGLGVREAAFVVLLAPQGVAEASAVALSLFQFAVILMIGLVGIPVTLFGRAPRACSP